MKMRAGNGQEPSYRLDDSGSDVVAPVKVVFVLDLPEDAHLSGITRGMRVLDLGRGVGDVSLWIAKLVGPTGLVVGVDETTEVIDVAEKRATVAGRCYWTRFVTADVGTFLTRERFDAVLVRHALLRQGEHAILLRLSNWVHPDGVIIIMAGEPAGTADNHRSSIRSTVRAPAERVPGDCPNRCRNFRAK
jgi:2-polyprenyl-3-methyl-5-hydroxy-6-metoxy-1,4-benzoquinol methylase